nr:hypothetical protein [Pandoravirus aubagnensis]
MAVDLLFFFFLHLVEDTRAAAPHRKVPLFFPWLPPRRLPHVFFFLGIGCGRPHIEHRLEKARNKKMSDRHCACANTEAKGKRAVSLVPNIWTAIALPGEPQIQVYKHSFYSCVSDEFRATAAIANRKIIY